MTRFSRGSLRPAILKYITRNPGELVGQIATGLKTHPASIQTVVALMIADGTLARHWKRGPIGQRGYAYWIAKDEVVAAPDQLKAEVATLAGRISDLHAEIEALQTWKADAIAAHPDLGDPLLLKAREMAASWWDERGDSLAAEECRSGLVDDGVMVPFALTVLRRAAQEA